MLESFGKVGFTLMQRSMLLRYNDNEKELGMRSHLQQVKQRRSSQDRLFSSSFFVAAIAVYWANLKGAFTTYAACNAPNPKIPYTEKEKKKSPPEALCEFSRCGTLLAAICCLALFTRGDRALFKKAQHESWLFSIYSYFNIPYFWVGVFFYTSYLHFSCHLCHQFCGFFFLIVIIRNAHYQSFNKCSLTDHINRWMMSFQVEIFPDHLNFTKTNVHLLPLNNVEAPMLPICPLENRKNTLNINPLTLTLDNFKQVV